MMMKKCVIPREAEPTEGIAILTAAKPDCGTASPGQRSLRSLRSLGMTLVLVAACSKPATPPPPAVPVKIATATQIAAPLTLGANGVVEPMQTVSIQAQIGGTLDEVSFREGDEVQAGQVLFRLDPRPFEAALRQAEGTLSRDEVQAGNTLREAVRYKTLDHQ